MQTLEPARATAERARFDWMRLGAAWWAWAGVAIIIVVGIGGPLFGRGVFAGTDMLALWPPWRAEAPPGFRPENANVGDTVNSLIPLRDVFAERIRDGDFPLWASLPGGGVPLGATPDIAALSPIALPYLITPIWYAPALTKAVEMVVAAVFMALYVRRLGAGWFAGGVAGAIYIGTGFQVAWVNWPQTLVGAAIPVLFWAVERAIQERRVVAAVPVALATAVMFAGGFPAVAGWALLLAGAYALIRCIGLPISGRRRALTLATLAAMVALGVGLMAFQLIPFAEGLDARGGLEYRNQEPDDHLPLGALATAVVPDALGSYANDNYWGPRNNVETLSFLGVTAVALAAIGFVGGRRVRIPVGVRGVLWPSLAVALILTYVGGPLLAVAQDGLPPLFDSNFIGRMRSIIGFIVAVLAGIGAHVLVTSPSLRLTRAEWLRAGIAAVVLGGLLAVVGLSAYDAAAYHDRLSALRDAAIAPSAVAAALIVTLVLAIAKPPGRMGVVALVPVLVAIEALLVIRPLWPRIERDQFYPVTGAHVFLHEHLGLDRLVSDDRAFEPGATTFYGLRTVSAHAFHEPAWQQALRWVDPQAFYSPTFPKFTMPEDDPYRVAASPIMDRLAARFYAVDPEQPLLGQRSPIPDGDGTIKLVAGESTTGTLTSGGTLRGVDVHVAVPPSAGEPVSALASRRSAAPPSVSESVAALASRRSATPPPAGEPIDALGSLPSAALPPAGESVAVSERDRRAESQPEAGPVTADLAVTVSAPSGDVIAEGRRRVQGLWSAGRLTIPIVETAVPPGSEVSLRLEDATGPIGVAADWTGEVIFGGVRARDDGLRLVYADGVVIYERLGALPRLRWAASEKVAATPEERRALLSDPTLPDDVVVLNEPGPGADGRPGEVRLVEESGDELTLDVSAAGAGYAVVADAMQRGWRATVDGDSAEVRAADQAVVAIWVPAGEHRIHLWYEPPGWRLGIAVSLASALVLLLLALLPIVRARVSNRDRRVPAEP